MYILPLSPYRALMVDLGLLEYLVTKDRQVYLELMVTQEMQEMMDQV